MNKRIKLTKRSLSVLLCLVLVFSVFCVWQNNDITVSQYTYKSEKIGQDLNEYKIVQLSDLHNKLFGKEQKRLLKVISEQQPDCIVITGDIVDGYRTDVDKALELVKGAAEIAPIYYVNGNHEGLLSSEEKQKLNDGMKKAGVIILNNQSVTVNCGSESFYIMGINDDNSGDLNTLRMMTSVQSLADSLTILLAHKPQHIDNYSVNNIDLVFSGHAHGGQVRLPFVGGVVAPEQGFFPEYSAGEYLMGSTTMIVSRGLGNSVIPFRIFNRPDVVSVVLSSEV